MSGKHHHRFAGTTSREPGLDFLPALQAAGASVSPTPGPEHDGVLRNILCCLCLYTSQHPSCP